MQNTQLQLQTNSLERQREQSEWETGGTNIPIVSCSTPFVQSNVFVFVIANTGTVPIYNIHAQIKYLNKIMLVGQSKPPPPPGVMADEPINVQEKEVYFPNDIDVGTLNPRERRQFYSAEANVGLLLSMGGDSKGGQCFEIAVHSLNASIWGFIEWDRIGNLWAFQNAMVVTLLGKEPHKFVLRTSSPDYPYKSNWDATIHYY